MGRMLRPEMGTITSEEIAFDYIIKNVIGLQLLYAYMHIIVFLDYNYDFDKKKIDCT